MLSVDVQEAGEERVVKVLNIVAVVVRG